MSPLVSIVINNFNYGRYVGRAIDSAFAQTYANVEVIVVDDGSTDNSRDVIERYADRASIILKPNGGQASAMNAGICRSQGQFILLLDADDFLFPDAVQTCVDAFPEGYSRVYFRLRTVNEHGHPSVAESPANRFEVIDGDVFGGFTDVGAAYLGPPTSGNLFDAAILKSVVPIPECEYRICADAYILVKTSLQGFVRGIDCVLGAYRIHGRNAFAFRSSLYADARALRTQIVNYFRTAALRDEVFAKRALPGRPAPPYASFWVMHLLSAGRVWDVDELRAQGVTRMGLLVMTGLHLLHGHDAMPTRSFRTMYLAVLNLAPRFAGRWLLRRVDRRTFARGKLSAAGHWSTTR